MKRFFLLVSTALAILGAGCDSPIKPSTATNEDVTNQIFEQKKQCETAYLAYKQEKENRTDFSVADVNVMAVCYSRKYSSCVGYYHIAVSKTKKMMTWEIKDLLTGEFISHESEKESAIFGPGFSERRLKFMDDVDGIDCSDGQHLGGYPIY